MHGFSHTYWKNANILFIFVVLVHNLMHISRFLYVSHNLCSQRGVLAVFHTYQSSFFEVRNADHHVDCVAFLDTYHRLRLGILVHFLHHILVWILHKIKTCLFSIQNHLQATFVKLSIDAIFWHSSSRDMKIHFLIHKCSFFVVGFHEPIYGMTNSLMLFSTIRSVSKSPKNSIPTSSFFRHSYHANLGPTKSMQNQTCIFLCNCWGSFWTHQLIVVYHVAHICHDIFVGFRNFSKIFSRVCSQHLWCFPLSVKIFIVS